MRAPRPEPTLDELREARLTWLLAAALMLLWANDFRAVFWVAVIPGLLAVVLLMFGVKEPERHAGARRTNPIRKENLGRRGRPARTGRR